MKPILLRLIEDIRCNNLKELKESFSALVAKEKRWEDLTIVVIREAVDNYGLETGSKSKTAVVLSGIIMDKRPKRNLLVQICNFISTPVNDADVLPICRLLAKEMGMEPSSWLREWSQLPDVVMVRNFFQTSLYSSAIPDNCNPIITKAPREDPIPSDWSVSEDGTPIPPAE